ncbi:hypothetical protein KY334_01180 [Candidatus Woesearchaeota archaeon]|nr:hypothetical protein [Candidatus Woesearchaeota archaeon]
MNLNELTNKKNIILTKRGNRAILLALRYAKNKGYEHLYFADQGSWITYEQYGRKLKFKLHRLMTEKGLIKFNRIKENAAVIFNDMPSYAFLQNEFNPEELKKKNILSIGDITGSIGTRICKADILVCSFSDTKMIDVGSGGCIASDLDLELEDEFDEKELIQQRIDELPDRLKFLRQKREEIISKIGKDKVIHYDPKGINILTKKDSSVKIYCESQKLTIKECPMDIKIKEPAYSIEVQELKHI